TRAEAAVGRQRRAANGDVRVGALNGRDGLRALGRLGDDLEVGLALERGSQGRPKDAVFVGDQDLQFAWGLQDISPLSRTMQSGTTIVLLCPIIALSPLGSRLIEVTDNPAPKLLISSRSPGRASPRR